MEENIHYYSGEQIEVSYGVNRVFTPESVFAGFLMCSTQNKRPWIDPDNAGVDDLSDVTMECPTGAIQFERTDGGPDEPIPDENLIIAAPDGPLYLREDIEIMTPDDTTLLEDTRVALCRCGASDNKPPCDNSHVDMNFEADGTNADAESDTQTEDADSVLTVSPMPDGPVRVQGQFEIRQADDTATIRDSSTALCRWGASANNPFCDGTHSEIGFSSDNQS